MSTILRAGDALDRRLKAATRGLGVIRDPVDRADIPGGAFDYHPAPHILKQRLAGQFPHRNPVC